MLTMKKIRENTNKKIIVNNIFEKTGLPASYTSKLFNNIIEIIISNIFKDKKFKINNFGTFLLRKKKNRIGRNPKNKVNYIIAERNVVTFKPAENLKNKVNLSTKKHD